MKTFEELGVTPALLQAITEMGYEHPMPVQEAVIPYLLHERSDVVALAQTGTGKTAAFGIPVIQCVDTHLNAPQALILCPTRELCLQIAGDLSDYSKYVPDLRVLPVYGGSSIESQIRSLKRGVHIIVATPGRLLDLMNRRTVNLENVRTVVMDEADEMLNMGFTDSINAILAEIPQERNILLFSATMPPEIARIAKNYMKSPKEITIGSKNEGAKNIKHRYYLVHARDKYLALKRIADYYPNIYGIIFCRTRRETQEVADKLIQDGYNADALHGELSQAQRDAVMQKFRIRNLQLLVATDVAARGLDVDDLTHVINYGFPDDVETYTHRSGRTGRAGKTGTSLAIIHVKERGKLRDIERIIGKKFEKGTVPTAREIGEKQLFNLVDRLEKVSVNEEEIAAYLPTVLRRLEWLSSEDLVKRIVSLEFNRLLDYYKEAAELDIPDERTRDNDRRDRRDSPDEKMGRGASKGFTRLHINLGKSDGLYPNQLIDLLNHYVGGRVAIGKIDLMGRFSFFEVESKEVPNVLESLNGGAFNGQPITVQEAEGAPVGGGYRGKRFSDRGERSDRSGDRKSYSKSKYSDRPRREDDRASRNTENRRKRRF